MKQINTLIVEDNAGSRQVINIALKKVSDCQINVIGEADSVDAANKIIEDSASNPVQLVFLDYNLRGNKVGIELSRKYPSLAYIVISSESRIMEIINTEKQNHTLHYMEHITGGGVYTIKSIVDAVTKYLSVL